jgi:hypothetical protein
MKYVLGLLILGGLLYGGYLYFSAQYLEDGAYATTPSAKATQVWRMEAMGEDPRVYEWSPKTMPGVKCVTWSATNKATTFCK